MEAVWERPDNTQPTTLPTAKTSPVTWAGLNPDHAPLEVRAKAKLGRHPQPGGARATARYDSVPVDGGARAALDEGVVALTPGVDVAETVYGAWEVLRGGALGAMGATHPASPGRPAVLG